LVEILWRFLAQEKYGMNHLKKKIGNDSPGEQDFGRQQTWFYEAFAGHVVDMKSFGLVLFLDFVVANFLQLGGWFDFFGFCGQRRLFKWAMYDT
jgi:hypothetical protein